jgi:Glycosyl hydrolases family 2, TIM barrel domain/Glycosyl hydrolases family 2/Glycosyl hydrolases family 2, sugar binding domain
MKLLLSLWILMMTFSPMAVYAASENSLRLNGTWEFLPHYGDATPEELSQVTNWGTCHVPALWWEAKDVPKEWFGEGGFNETDAGWYRREFTVPAEFEGKKARFEVESALWGAQVWINGVMLGEHLGGYAPFGFDFTDEIRFGESNEVYMKLTGWGGIPRNEEGSPLISVGVVAEWANRSAGVTGDVVIEFHDKVRIKSLQVLPEIDSGKVIVRVDVESDEKSKLLIEAFVAEDDHLNKIRGKALQKIEMIPGSRVGELIVPVEKYRLWHPDHPNLYRLVVQVTDQESNELLDQKEERFGFRLLERKGNKLYLNHEPFKLRGSTLFEEPRFKRGWESATDDEFLRHYLADYPKKMNLNVLRSHLGPMNDQWLDICDEQGMLIILEFPVFHWIDDERFQNFVNEEYAELLPRLWNHPSIIMWAISNEGWNDPQREIENNKVAPWFRGMDPTRLVMRAGDPTEDVADIHAYEGFWHGTSQDFISRSDDLVRMYPDRPIGNTEYLETGANSDGIWYNKGREKRFFDEVFTGHDLLRKHAGIAMAQTEWLRQRDFQIIMGYWYADWVNDTDWIKNRQDRPTPAPKETMHAMKQAFSPVGVSADLLDQNIVPGQSVSFDMWVFNDVSEKLNATVDLYLLPINPHYRSEIFPWDKYKPLSSGKVKLTANEHLAFPIKVKIPSDISMGKAWLAAVIHGKTIPTAMSQRPVTVTEPVILGLRKTNVLLLGDDSELEFFLSEQGATVYKKVNEAPNEAVVIVSAMTSDTPVTEDWFEVRKRIEQGARCLVMQRKSETPQFPEVPEFHHPGMGTDNLFASVESGLPDLRDPNGLKPIQGYSLKMAEGDQMLLWGYHDSSSVKDPAVVLRPLSQGEIIAVQIELEGRLSPIAAHVDPFCRLLMVELLKKNLTSPP